LELIFIQIYAIFVRSEDLTHKAESPLKIHVLKKLLFNAMGFVKPAINFSL